MPDVLIRDVPPDDLARLDALAAKQGLSRTEYLRRRLHHEAARSEVTVTLDDLHRLAEHAADLADPEVMKQAWS